MRTPRPLPAELPAVFTYADAVLHGVGRSRLNGPDLERPFHGVLSRIPTASADTVERDPAEHIRADIRRRARAYATQMRPTEFFSHRTAAILWDIPLPRAGDRLLDVSVLRHRRAPRGAGVRGHEIDPRLVRVTVNDGLQLTTPASTWAGLATMLHPYDLVAAGDAIVCVRDSIGSIAVGGPPPLATLDQLQAVIEAGRRPGVGALRNAVCRVRTGSWSRLETWVRLILVDANLPEPVLNFDAFDEAGRFLGCVDLAYPDLKIAIEYEGAHHWSTPEQIQHDIDRLDRLVENGWRIVRLTKGHVFTNPDEVVRRVSVARVQRSGAH